MNRIGLFQYYRIIAIYLVVLIHQQFWRIDPVIGNVLNWAVPLFAAISGCLYAASSDYGFLEIVKRKAKRLVLPYAIWATIYFVANNIVLDVFIRHGNMRIPSISEWLIRGTANHLWFLTCLFIAFVFAEALRAVLKNSFIARWRFCDVLWISAIISVGVASQWLPGETSATFSGFVKIYLGRLFFYFGIGGAFFYVSQRHFPHVLLGVIFLIVGCVNLWVGLMFGAFWQPLMAVAGLVTIALGLKQIRVPTIVDNIGKMSMGIYLVHLLWTSLANVGVQYMGYQALPWSLAIPVTLFIYVVSYWSVRFLPSMIRG